MKQLFILIMFLAFKRDFFAQTNNVDEKNICGEWIVTKGWFDKEVIELERLDTLRHKSIGTKFTFDILNPEGVYNVFNYRMSANLYNPEKLGLCGNGLLYTDKGEWSFKENELTIDIKGGHRIESEFHYITVYDVIQKEDKMILTRKKVIKNYVKNYGM